MAPITNAQDVKVAFSSATANVNPSLQSAAASTWNQATALHAKPAFYSTHNKAPTKTATNASTQTPTATEKTSTSSVSDAKPATTSRLASVNPLIPYVAPLTCTEASVSHVMRGIFWKAISVYPWHSRVSANGMTSRMSVFSVRIGSLLIRRGSVERLILPVWPIKWREEIVWRASLGSGPQMDYVLRLKTLYQIVNQLIN